MKSTAHIKGIPIHPILVSFPIAFFTGTLIFDTMGIISSNNTYWQTGEYLEIAGIVSALTAAVPGAIDFFYTIPPKSSASSRAALHGLLNICLLLIYVVAYWLRQVDSALMVVILEAAGFIIMLFSGWMGATLVNRNLIGVNPRYADSGRWREERYKQSSGMIEVGTVDELRVDQMKLMHIGDRRIVLGRTENGYVAFNDHCSHKGGSLASGMLMCGTVQCPWHGSQFDVKTGKPKSGPAEDNIPIYEVIEREGKIFVII